MSADCNDRITVVVLTHNRSAELCRSLERLLVLPEQPSIIVVDNGSTDCTVDNVTAGLPRVRLVRSESNLGAAGRNLGVECVRTPYVAFSDDDTWWAPGALCNAVELLDRHPRIAVLNARIVVGPEARADPACDAMEESPLGHLANVGPMLTGFMAGAVVMRADAYRQAGGYWHALFIGGEEALLAMDILDAGGQIVYAPTLQVHHWPSQSRDSMLRRRLTARNAIWTAWLRLPWRLAWQRTARTLKALPDSALRWRVLGESLSGAGLILRRRRVLHRDTCELLERVWRSETRPR